MKTFLGYVTNKIVQAIPRKKKISPDIKSVKPTKDIAGSVKRTKSDEYVKRIRELEGAEKKIKSGKVKIKIFKKYKLEEVIQAHQDLEGRKILGPAVIVPN